MNKKYPIVKGSTQEWWDGLTPEEKFEYGGEVFKHSKWVELSRALRDHLCIMTLDLKR